MEKKIARHLKRIQNDAHPNNDEAENKLNSKNKQKKLRSHIKGSRDWVFFLLFTIAMLKDIFDIVLSSTLEESKFSSFGTVMVIAGVTVFIIGGVAFIAGALTSPTGAGAIIAAIGAKLSSWGITLMTGGMASQGIGEAIQDACMAMAIIVPFIFNTLFLSLTVTALALSGSSNLFTRWKAIIAITIVEFIAESFFGLDWLPWTSLYVVALYYIVLKKRKKQALRQSLSTA